MREFPDGKHGLGYPKSSLVGVNPKPPYQDVKDLHGTIPATLATVVEASVTCWMATGM